MITIRLRTATPNESNRREVTAEWRGRTRTAATIAPLNIMAPNQYEAWKSNSSAINTVNAYPRPAPTEVVMESKAIVRLDSSGGRFLRAMAIATGRTPKPMPWKPRPTRSKRKPFDAAESTQPAITAPSPTRTTSRWWGPSAIRPITGVASAPVSRVMVITHCAVLSDTPSALAMVGINGAPRLDTMAMSEPE